MIKDDVKRIREGKSPKIRGGMLEDLTDDFRGGRRQQNELLELLDDQDEYYINVVFYILNEITLDSQYKKPFRNWVEQLLNHEDRSIRCEVLLFVGELFSENEARLIYKNMSKDKDSFVSKTASNLYRFGTAYS